MADNVQGVPAPPPPPPPASVQAGKQTQQQHQDHPTPPAPAHTLPAHIPTAQQGQQIVHLNWYHFKPEFSG